MKEIIEAAGYELNDESLDDAKWLLENGLALTKIASSIKDIPDKNSYGLRKSLIRLFRNETGYGAKGCPCEPF